jgi:UTP--glucose-1-phosphate uridylyltransferase
LKTEFIMHKKITRAVFPVAGLGTRFLPATKASPKEMLPVVDKPLIQYAVEEAAAAGITDMIFVTGRNKRAIEDHFDKSYELEMELEARHKDALLDVLHQVKPDHVECYYVRQAEALGLGHAVLCAERLLHQEPFAVILADDLLDNPVPVLRQMMRLFGEYGSSLVAVEKINRAQAPFYGVISATPFGRRLLRMQGIVEKPRPEQAPSDMGVVGRYILTPAIFRHLHALRASGRNGNRSDKYEGSGGELQLTDAIAALLREETVLAYEFFGVRYDCGSKQGYLQATVQFALKHPEVRDEFRRFLQHRSADLGSTATVEPFALSK